MNRPGGSKFDMQRESLSSYNSYIAGDSHLEYSTIHLGVKNSQLQKPSQVDYIEISTLEYSQGTIGSISREFLRA